MFRIALSDVCAFESRQSGDGYIQLPDDHKVSREHCKIDAGPLAVLVTDLGSSKGTKLDSKDGKKVMAKIILVSVHAASNMGPAMNTDGAVHNNPACVYHKAH